MVLLLSLRVLRIPGVDLHVRLLEDFFLNLKNVRMQGYIKDCKYEIEGYVFVTHIKIKRMEGTLPTTLLAFGKAEPIC